MAFLPVLRLIILIATLVFSIIVLGLCAHVTAVTVEFLHGFFNFAAMAIAVSGLTIITLPVMIGIDFVRRGAFTSMVLVELGWLCFLWILWLAAAALTAQEQQFLFAGSTSCDFFNDELNAACNEFAAIEAFSFLAWISLLGYTIALLSYAIIGATRGTRPWTSTVGDGLLTPREGAGVPASGFDQEKYTTGGGASIAPSSYVPPSQMYESPQASQHAYPPQQEQPMVAQV
ncbi:hypothetical protein BDP27DRAFT_1414458 [Rhodocollybia butyracea]|uniref:MARVEL domain-containing protein n=1 Tax=Rhodocollybia butyracea TaxID=206335 RepID=A0A9P5UDW1_9AGAR|nr:hypothetical protein BDP27DRAFT_1414458 [Rhodocollybia butyracea]